jgi:hypothetical protein
MEIGPAHLISAGRRVSVGHGPPTKWPMPRAGVVGHPSPPGRAHRPPPCPRDRHRLGFHLPQYHVAPRAPTFVIALIRCLNVEGRSQAPFHPALLCRTTTLQHRAHPRQPPPVGLRQGDLLEHHPNLGLLPELLSSARSRP